MRSTAAPAPARSRAIDPERVREHGHAFNSAPGLPNLDFKFEATVDAIEIATSFELMPCPQHQH